MLIIIHKLHIHKIQTYKPINNGLLLSKTQDIIGFMISGAAIESGLTFKNLQAEGQ